MDEIPGLDVYEALLGRLNGKPEVEVKKEQDQRESVKRSKYIEQKFGTVRFVSAGLLITDEMTKAGGEQP